ncbi:MAG: hypothetical protein JF616_01000 [Fibrobacteres bacterium]|nr:hypothetical protein [Fibrobacterota bacterium]
MHVSESKQGRQVGRTAWAAVFAVLLAAPARSQELSQVEKGLNDLQFQMGQFEGEMGKLRKAVAQGAPASKAARSKADSLLPALTARYDSLSARISALEAAERARAAKSSLPPDGGNQKVTGAPVAASAGVPAHPDADTTGQGDLRALRKEMRELTALLQSTRASTPPASPSPAPSAAPAAKLPALPAGPATVPASSPLPPALTVLGDVQIQGERRFATGSKQDNLDNFWGRVNIGTEYKSPGFQSKVNLRIFPEGFGYEPLTGATFDTTGQGALKTQTQPSSKLLVNHAWVRFTPGAFGIRFGRFETQESQSATYGNYIDLGPSGAFLARPAVHNATEGTWSNKAWSSSVLLGASDKKLDRGFLRALQKFTAPSGLQAMLGYRANVFDGWKYPDAPILQRFDAGVLSPLGAGWQAFAEGAVLQADGKADDTPLLLGIRPPMGKYLDALSLEAEWSPNRKVAGKDKEILYNAYVRKAWGKARLEAGLYSDATDPDANAFSAGVRITSSLK